MNAILSMSKSNFYLSLYSWKMIFLIFFKSKNNSTSLPKLLFSLKKILKTFQSNPCNAWVTYLVVDNSYSSSM